jgi:hypothetical protein
MVKTLIVLVLLILAHFLVVCIGPLCDSVSTRATTGAQLSASSTFEEREGGVSCRAAECAPSHTDFALRDLSRALGFAIVFVSVMIVTEWLLRGVPASGSARAVDTASRVAGAVDRSPVEP